MSRKPPVAARTAVPTAARFAVIAARFNQSIVDELLRGCVARLGELGVRESKIEIFRVPGAFELPVAAKLAARARRFSAIVCLGAVIRGDTPHFDYVAGQAARGIAQVALDEAIPVIFGVLTTNTQAQARQRIGGSHGHAGQRAAEAAIEMAALAKSLVPRR